jgi:hypothetical protein
MKDNSISVHFSDVNKSGYFVKFGKLEHLRSFQSGKIRFSRPGKYRDHENQYAIGDTDEGLSQLIHRSPNTTFSFSHPNIINGKIIDITSSIEEFKQFPNSNAYILCLSRLIATEIIKNNTIDNKILNEQDWNSALIIFGSLTFTKNIAQVTKKSHPIFGPVNYYDYTQDHNDLGLLSKSNKYSFEREVRFIIDVDEKDNEYKQIDKNTIEVQIEDFSSSSIIIPTKDLLTCFVIGGKE